MPRMPVWVAKALKEGWARSHNQYLQLTYPTGETRFNISPSLIDKYWLVYGWNYGQMLNSNGVQHYSSDFKFEWVQSGIRAFEDYMTASMMNFTYPVFLIVTLDDPVVTIAKNNTGDLQTIDFTTFLILFDTQESYEKWSDWFEKRYSISPWKRWQQEIGKEELKKEVLGE